MSGQQTTGRPAAAPPCAADLRVSLAGVELPNPVMPASGTFEPFEEGGPPFPLEELGAIVNKTVFWKPRPGNPPPRIHETPSGMLNSIGIPSKGVERFVAEELPHMAALGIPVIASIAGESVAEWRRVARRIEGTGLAHLLELDLSCPNLRSGVIWASDRRLMSRVIAAVRDAVRLPVVAKLSPSVTDIAALAEAAEAAGASALSLVNTYRGMAIDLDSRRPVLGNVTGGLSGPAIRPLAVYAVYACWPRVQVPIIGIGGIAGWEDAVEFLLAGATAVAVGTWNFVEPDAMRRIVGGIGAWLDRQGFGSVRQVIGLAHGPSGSRPRRAPAG